MKPLASHDAHVGLLVTAVRRHLTLVLAVTLLALAGAAGYAYHRSPRYTATATVLPRPAAGNPLAPETSASNGTQLTVAILTEAGLVDTPTVSALASKALGSPVPGPGDVITTAVPANTQIIRISYTSRTPLAARNGARAMANAFLQYRRGVAATTQLAVLTRLQNQARATAVDLQSAARAAARNPDPRSYAAQRVLLYSDRLATVNDSISVTQALSTDPGVVVTAPSLPASPNGISPLVFTVAGGLIGLAVGLLLATRLEWRRGVVDATNEYELDGVPLLAKLPEVPASAPALVSDAGAGAIQEAYRRMRAGLIAVAEPPRTIAVSCVSPGDSSGRIGANLGISLAQAGFRVTVVAADPFDREAERLLGARPSPGLAEIILEQSQPSEAVQPLHGISFIASGKDPVSGRERYAGPRLGALLSDLRGRADYVIVICAEASSSDADAVALACDAMVVVVVDQLTTYNETASALDRFRRLDVPTVGVVAVPVERGPSRSRGGQAAPIPQHREPAAPTVRSKEDSRVSRRVPHAGGEL